MHLSNLKALSSALNAKDYYTLGHAARVAAYMVLLGRSWAGRTSCLRAGRGGGLPARHRQDRRAGPRAAQAERAQRRRVGADAAAPRSSAPRSSGRCSTRRSWPACATTTSAGTATATRTASPAQDIPVVARAMCVVDSYDAMSFRRPYRPGPDRRRVPRGAGALQRRRSSTRRWWPRSAACSSGSARAAASRPASPAEAAARPRSRGVPRAAGARSDEARPEYAAVTAKLREARATRTRRRAS